jgi:hypothetical protein
MLFNPASGLPDVFNAPWLSVMHAFAVSPPQSEKVFDTCDPMPRSEASVEVITMSGEPVTGFVVWGPPPRLAMADVSVASPDEFATKLL